jgi:anti-sigma regulatory factor (Ser/Thr protein kinase)
VESSRNFHDGYRSLETALGESGIGEARDPASYLRDVLLKGGARDDVAILTLRAGSLELRRRGVTAWHFDSLSAQSLHRLRKDVAALLEPRAIGTETIQNAELVLGELAGNAVRHAAGSVDVMLDLGGPEPVLHVIDEGPGFARAPMLPSDLLSETGRGLFIVSQVTREFSVARRHCRGSHARAVLVL